jgi:uncharacterized protein YuzE
MSVTIDGLLFEHHNYDADGDVLYLSRGESRVAADGLLTSEGHGVRFDPDGEVIGLTLINVKWLLEQDGYVTVTVPRTVHVQEDELGGVLG